MLEMWPYPSGTLHMGHTLVYTIGDVLARFRRRNGLNVMHVMGFDSFGLPAENAAIREGGHPREIVERNIAEITADDEADGLGLRLEPRCVSAHEPEYYRWTQWLFLKLFEAGLAYRKGAPVKWCPFDQVVLANEQVHDGRCEYCGTEVIAKNLEQWFFKTTAYADELLDDLPTIDWQDRIKAMQRNWIGRSEGAEVLFRIEELDEDVAGLHDAARHALRRDVLRAGARASARREAGARARRTQDELREYVSRAAVKRGEERAAAEEKTGVFTGFFATNPVNEARIPIWVADYVLMDYGTGAIMAVPAHDERDGEFAETLRPADRAGDRRGREADRLRAVQLAARRGGEARDRRLARGARPRPAGDQLPTARLGLLAAALLGLPDPDRLLRRARRRSLSRTTSCRVSCPRSRTTSRAESRRSRSAEDWVRAPCPVCGKEGRREVETMDTFVDSSWYFLRYCDPRQRRRRVGPEARRLVVPGRPVHRRRRPRDDAPDLRALLHQGAERSRPRRLP